MHLLANREMNETELAVIETGLLNEDATMTRVASERRKTSEGIEILETFAKNAQDFFNMYLRVGLNQSFSDLIDSLVDLQNCGRFSLNIKIKSIRELGSN